jgi:patatin-like phospholipase/acyl hydrolase
MIHNKKTRGHLYLRRCCSKRKFSLFGDKGKAMQSRFNILSLSGGGFLGLYTISVIAALEEITRGPIARNVDIIAGTSVGGIIALGLAAEVPAINIRVAFERNGTAIFSNRPAAASRFEIIRDIGRSLLRPRYQADALRQAIVEIVGEEARLGDLKHRVLIPAVNLTKGRPQVFKTPHHPTFRMDLNLKLVDVALATSAAPTYFPIAAIDDALYADGGLYANSPDLFALHETEHFLGQVREAIYLLSIGTTTTQYSFPHAHGRQFGLLKWSQQQRLVNVIISSQQHAVDYIMRHQLKERYLRLDASQSKEQERHLALDVATEDAQKTIRGLAAGTVQARINDAELQSFLSHEAAAPAFYHGRASG